MAVSYRVRALDAHHCVQSLRIDAVDEAAARQLLEARGLQVLSLKTAPRFGGPARTRFDTLLFVDELRALLEAGLELVEALQLLERKEERDAATVIARLREVLVAGVPLSQALQLQPDVFAPLLAGLVRAAEETGDVPAALGRFAAHERRLEGLKQQLVSALLYPGILVAAGGAVTLFLLLHVVPRFAAVYDSTGKPLPWASALLLDWGRWVDQHAAVVLWVLLGVVVALALWVRRLNASGGWVGLMALVPGLGARLEVLAQSRLYFTLGTLLEGGIPLAQALTMAAETSATAAERLLLHRIHRDIQDGKPLSQAFREQSWGTEIALRLVAVGEQTGQLGCMLAKAAVFHEGEAVRWMTRFAKLLEPALMLGMGVGVGGIVVLLYMPVFELAGSL